MRCSNAARVGLDAIWRRIALYSRGRACREWYVGGFRSSGLALEFLGRLQLVLVRRLPWPRSAASGSGWQSGLSGRTQFFTADAGLIGKAIAHYITPPAWAEARGRLARLQRAMGQKHNADLAVRVHISLQFLCVFGLTEVSPDTSAPNAKLDYGQQPR